MHDTRELSRQFHQRSRHVGIDAQLARADLSNLEIIDVVGLPQLLQERMQLNLVISWGQPTHTQSEPPLRKIQAGDDYMNYREEGLLNGRISSHPCT